ncbi:MAG: flagellar L-ring protein [marine bacterium B5-7]|nr:MAG: flagellar L-ring protein [marine bacterium B5-7]
MREYLNELNFYKVIMMIGVSLLISGCQGTAKRDPAFAAVRPPLPPVEPESNGGIYKPGFDVRLFEDLKARRVGDILTVRLAEATNANKSTSTEIEKTNTSSISNPTIFGASPEFSVPKFLPLDRTEDLGLASNLSSDHEFDGSGSTAQTNALTGSIPVSVVEVLPNGNLIVRGEKRVTLNNGVEYVQLSGIIRPVDILADNSVLSTQVADATINYTGEGAVAESSLIGWLARFFASPFMPY